MYSATIIVRYFGIVLLLAIFLMGFSIILKTVIAASSFTIPASLFAEETNAAPTVTNVKLNGNAAITLTPNTSTAVTISFTVTDTNGCTDVFTSGNVTSTAFRFSVGISCTTDNANCYRVSTSTHNCISADSADATATVQLQYYADATDASSSYSSQHWEAHVIVRDSENATGSATSTAVEVNTLLAINVETSTIPYGSLSSGENTGATNQTAAVKNAGNSSTSLNISGTAGTSGANVLATSSQHYATTTFTFGGSEQTLSGTPTAVSGLTIRAMTTPPLASWAETTAMPAKITTHVTIFDTKFNYFYRIGGGVFAEAKSTSSVFSAFVNATGSLGAWTEQTALPRGLRTSGDAFNNGFIYVIGGIDDAGVTTSTIYYTSTTSAGGVNAWQQGTALPSAIRLNASAAYNGYLYNSGGTDGTNTTTVRFASINASGSLGSWTNTTALPTSTRNHALVPYSGIMYKIGGIDQVGNVTSGVLYATINSNGTLGSWTNTTALPAGRGAFGHALNNGKIFVIAGQDTVGIATSSVLYSSINADGTLGSWTTLPSLPSSTQGHKGSLLSNGFLYRIGGSSDGTTSTATSSVEYAPLDHWNTYWGIEVPTGQAGGVYSGVNTFDAIFKP